MPGPTVARKPDADMLHQAMRSLALNDPDDGGFAGRCLCRQERGRALHLAAGIRRESNLEDYGVDLVVDEVSQITERLRGSLAIS